MSDTAPHYKVRATMWWPVALAISLFVAQFPPLAASAATVAPERVIEAWAASTSHPLVGRIWTAHDGRLIDGIALSRGLATGTPVADALGVNGPAYVLFGEIHDNAEHHLLRAALIEAIAKHAPSGRTAHLGVVAEHIDDRDGERLAGINHQIARGEATADAVLAALDWGRSGWPAASLFRPLFAAIVEARLPLYAGNVPREEIRTLVRNGPDAIPASRRERFGLDRTLPPPLQAVLAAELAGSHCGMLPASAIDGMANAQRYRDGRMADAMIVAAAGEAGKAILLAGNGHVRTDRGVPWHIRDRNPQARILAVMLIEVEDGRSEPLTYVPRAPDGRHAADVIVFTPRAQREDPCEQMRARTQKKG